MKKICPIGKSNVITKDILIHFDQLEKLIPFCSSPKSFRSAWDLRSNILNKFDADLGYLSSGFCSTSEFENYSWAQKYGCITGSVIESSVSIQETQRNCDSSYPDFCIPSSPPDLDCKDISQKRFTVLPPDPHRFDGDKDGIGCES